MIEEVAIALIHGDLEYADILRQGGFVCHEKDKVKPASKNEIWGKQYIERKIRSSF